MLDEEAGIGAIDGQHMGGVLLLIK